MHTRESVKEFAEQFGFSGYQVAFGANAALEHLHTVLHHGEVLLGVIGGNERNDGALFSGCLLVVTNARIIRYRIGIFGKQHFREIPVSIVTSVSGRRGITHSGIEIITKEDDYNMNVFWMNKKKVEKMVPIIRRVIEEG